MGTRSTIALEFDNGSVKQIYVGYDGYLDGVGRTLLANYNTPEKVTELIEQGDMSYREDTVALSCFYGRDRDETGIEADEYSSFFEYLEQGDFESYNYIMRGGEWYVDRGTNCQHSLLTVAINDPQF